MWSLHPRIRPEATVRLETAADAVRLFGNDFRDARRELLRTAHLDHAGALVALTEQAGGRDALPIATRDILRDSCTHGTRRLVIAHNHPSGDPTPSRADRIATRRLAELLRVLDIQLVDHLVFAVRGIASFRAMGLL